MMPDFSLFAPRLNGTMKKTSEIMYIGLISDDEIPGDYTWAN
jgi:hypothetical protein